MPKGFYILLMCILTLPPTVVSCPPLTCPLYLQALMPTAEDAVDTVASEKLSEEKSTPSPTDPHSKLPTCPQLEQPSVKTEGTAESQELYENPFLKPPKRIRLKPL